MGRPRILPFQLDLMGMMLMALRLILVSVFRLLGGGFGHFYVPPLLERIDPTDQACSSELTPPCPCRNTVCRTPCISQISYLMEFGSHTNILYAGTPSSARAAWTAVAAVAFMSDLSSDLDL